MSRFVDLHEGPCPTCDGDGSMDAPFDANCPAAWAHRFIAYHGGHSAHDMDAARALRNIGVSPSGRSTRQEQKPS